MAGAADSTAAVSIAAPSWSVVTRPLAPAPPVQLQEEPTLGSFCAATAGFRDQFYGLAPFVAEAATVTGPKAPLITSGLIDPAHCRWGTRPTRFAGDRWQEPVVDLDALRADGGAALVTWTDQRLVPKLVVATQTKVLEAVVDAAGEWFPSVPTLAVTAADGRLWEAAAVVLAPPVSAWAFGRHAGAALSSDALKVSARQLLEAPLPTDPGCWAAAVPVLQRASSASSGTEWRTALLEFAGLMCRAYGVGDEVADWWWARLPAWSRP